MEQLTAVSDLLEQLGPAPKERKPRGRPKGSTKASVSAVAPSGATNSEELNPEREIAKLLADPELGKRERIQLIGWLVKWRAVQARIPMEEAGSGFSLDLDDKDGGDES